MLPKIAGRERNAGNKRKRGKHEWIRKKKQSPPSPPWTELPPDITANILHRLKAIEILENAQKVCTTWRSVCKDPSTWRVIDMSNSRMHDMPYDLEKMFRHAVDRRRCPVMLLIGARDSWWIFISSILLPMNRLITLSKDRGSQVSSSDMVLWYI